MFALCRGGNQCAISREAALGGGLECHDIDARIFTQGQRARPCFDDGVQRGPFVPQVMQLAAKIGQRLWIARFRPQRTRDLLSRDWRIAGMENQEGDYLLLSDARDADGAAARDQQAEAPEQPDAQVERTGHVAMLHRTSYSARSVT